MTKTPEQLAEEWANAESDLWFADISTYTDGHKSAVKQAYLAGYQAAQQWISVKDRLPPPEVEVLWWNKTAHQAGVSNWKYMSYCDDTTIEWGDAGNVSIKNFTHWMPLPAAPKEGL